jgi:hypothetical protein
VNHHGDGEGSIKMLVGKIPDYMVLHPRVFRCEGVCLLGCCAV